MELDFPDTRRIQVQEYVPFKMRRGKLIIGAWKLLTDDGQTLYVRRGQKEAEKKIEKEVSQRQGDNLTQLLITAIEDQEEQEEEKISNFN